MVVNQCVLYNKDPWRGPVGGDGKPLCTPLANTAVTPVDNNYSNPYKALVAKPYNYHLNHWWKAFIDNHGKYLLCHDTACNTNHKTQDCPILKKVGLEFEKQTDADNASLVAADALDSSPSSVPPPPTSGSLPSDTSGSSSTPDTFTASTAPDLYESGKEFDYEGKWNGVFYVSRSKYRIDRCLSTTGV
jgi:hypothetical protein